MPSVLFRPRTTPTGANKLKPGHIQQGRSLKAKNVGLSIKIYCCKNHHEIIILNSAFHNPYDYIIKFSSQILFIIKGEG